MRRRTELANVHCVSCHRELTFYVIAGVQWHWVALSYLDQRNWERDTNCFQFTTTKETIFNCLFERWNVVRAACSDNILSCVAELLQKPVEPRRLKKLMYTAINDIFVIHLHVKNGFDAMRMIEWLSLFIWILSQLIDAVNKVINNFPLIGPVILEYANKSEPHIDQNFSIFIRSKRYIRGASFFLLTLDFTFSFSSSFASSNLQRDKFICLSWSWATTHHNERLPMENAISFRFSRATIEKLRWWRSRRASSTFNGTMIRLKTAYHAHIAYCEWLNQSHVFQRNSD